MKIVFFGNSDFSILPLQQTIQNFDVVGLVTAPDSTLGRGLLQDRTNPVKTVAQQYNIPILQPATLKNNSEFSQNLALLAADLHVIVSYGKILPKELINIPKHSTINLHASLLPQLRGASPIQYALWQDLDHTGVTVQFISEKMDEGDIINQDFISIDAHDDYQTLEKKLSTKGAELLVQSIDAIKHGNTKRKPQNHQEATYTTLIKKEDGAIFFSMSAEEIFNAFRAFKTKPGIYLPSKIGNIKIIDCVVYSRENSAVEGEIIKISAEGIVVSCHEGSLLLKVLQAPNKRAINGKDFANGNRLKIKSVLE